MKPILFSTPMVQAILEGRKTMTRRIVKPQPSIKMGVGKWLKNELLQMIGGQEIVTDYMVKHNPYGQPGDVLWVREKFRKHHPVDEYGYIDFETTILDYAADNPEPLYLTDGDGFVRTNKDGSEKFVPFKPSIHMPKDACRLFLQITNIRVERLQEISQNDCVNEGIQQLLMSSMQKAQSGGKRFRNYLKKPELFNEAVSSYESFQTLWQSINSPESWEANPWVWVVEFKQIEKPKAI